MWQIELLYHCKRFPRVAVYFSIVQVPRSNQHFARRAFAHATLQWCPPIYMRCSHVLSVRCCGALPWCAAVVRCRGALPWCAAAVRCCGALRRCAAVVRCGGAHGMTRWWALARSADSCLAAVRQATLESPSGALHRAAAAAVYCAPIAHTSVKAGRQGGRLRKQPDRLYNQCDRLCHHDVLIEGEGSQKQLE